MTSDLLSYGKTYFNTIEELYPLFGNRPVDYDSAEVFIYTHNYTKQFHKAPKKRSVSDNLCMSYQRVERAEKRLRDLNLMKEGTEDKKGLRIKLDESDLAFKAYGIAESLSDWFKSNQRYQFLNLLHAIIYVADLKTAYNSRRQLVRCMCCGFEGCRSGINSIDNFKHDINYNMQVIEAAYDADTYSKDVKDLHQYQVNMHQELYQFNEARKILATLADHPDYWIKKPSQFTEYTWNTVRDICERRILTEYGKAYAAASLYRDLVYSTSGCLTIMRDRLHRIEYKEPRAYKVVNM